MRLARVNASLAALVLARGDFQHVPARYRFQFTPGLGLFDNESGAGGGGGGGGNAAGGGGSSGSSGHGAGGGGSAKTYTQAELDAELSGMRSKNSELLGAHKKLQERLKPFEGLEADAETIRNALTQHENAEEQRRKAEGDFNTWRTDISTKHTAALALKDGEITRVKTALERRLVDGALVKAISDAGGNDELLVPALRGQVRMVEESGDFVARVVDAKGTARLKNATEYMSIDDLVAETKAKPKFGVAFGAPAAAGGGAGGSGDASSSNAGSTSGHVLYISPEDAQDTLKYRAARAQADKEKKKLVIGKPGQK